MSEKQKMYERAPGLVRPSPAVIETQIKENVAKHKAALAEKPEVTPEREQVSREASDFVHTVLARARRLNDQGMIDKFSANFDGRNMFRDRAEYSEDEDTVVFNIGVRAYAAMLSCRRIVYSKRDEKGTIASWNAGPAGFSQNLTEVNFWEGESATANGSYQGTNAMGPHEEDLLPEDELGTALSVLEQQFQDALQQIEHQ